MKNIQLLSFLFISLSFYSCQKDIEIDANSLDTKIVIDGNINIGEKPQVIVRYSGFLYDTIDIESTYIHNAIVEVSDGTETILLEEKCYKIYNNLDSLLNNNDTINQNQFLYQLFSVDIEQMDSLYYHYFRLSPEEYEKSQLLCVYTENNSAMEIPMLGEENKNYTLKVTSGNKIITSSTKIPNKFEIDSLEYVVFTDDPLYSEVFIHVSFLNNVSLGTYVQYGSKTQGNPFYYEMRSGSVYSNAFFDGSSELRLPLEGEKILDEGRPVYGERLFTSGDTVTVIWKSIDKLTYDFIYTSENDGGATPFSSPVKIISNIEGGMGLWAGYNVSTKSIYIP